MPGSTHLSRIALVALCLALTPAEATPRVGHHTDRSRIVFDLPVKTTVQATSSQNTLTLTLPGTLLPKEGGALGVRKLSYRQTGNQIILTGNVQGITVTTLDSPAKGMRLIIDVPRNDSGGSVVVPTFAMNSAVQLNSACLNNTLPTLAAPRPPAQLSGRIGLFVAELDQNTLEPIRAVAYNADQVFPLASTYKQVVLFNVMQDIDAGKYTLDSTLTTTEAVRSMMSYPRGTNTIRFLAERLMKNSDNTANDMLHHTTGLLRPQQTADSLGLCNTRLLLTTKAFWAAEAGMGGKHFPRANLLQSALAFGSADRARQIAIARDLVQTSLKVNADQLLEALDGKNGYFLKRYDARIDLNTQNTSTPREFTLLVVHPFKAGKLSKSSLQFYRSVFAKGCCQPTPLPFPVNYWGSKNGIGWRLLNLTGYLELPDGRKFAYSYFNHESKITDTAALRPQIPAVLKWITESIAILS